MAPGRYRESLDGRPVRSHACIGTSPGKIDEANLQDRAAPLNAGGEESTSVDDDDLSKKTPPSGAEGNFSQGQHVPNPTSDSPALRRRENTRCSTTEDGEVMNAVKFGKCMTVDIIPSGGLYTMC